MPSPRSLTRRHLLRNTSALLLASTLPGRLLAETPLKPLEVASAGALRSLLEGPLATAAAAQLQLQLHEHAGGADAVAQQILSQSLHPDLFLSVTATPMQSLLHAGLASQALPIARSELVLTYSAKSRFAPLFAQVASGKLPWWKAVQQPGLKIGRGNPAADPGARCFLFAMMLAEKHYNLPGFAERLLGPAQNPAQLLPNVPALLQSGEIDLSASYKMSAIASATPFLPLAPEINLSQTSVATANPDIALDLDGRHFRPDPIVFYAAALSSAPSPAAAQSFLHWLLTPETQSIFSSHSFESASGLPVLTA
ncbi:MAG: extracellular solute-binding protein [Acidobacteriaceae bacterium]|nr:extracellular solute-binding protein [Acidobacteriaceae bacterium]